MVCQRMDQRVGNQDTYVTKTPSQKITLQEQSRDMAISRGKEEKGGWFVGGCRSEI